MNLIVTCYLRQDEFHDRLEGLQHQAKQSKDEMNNCKNEFALLERKLKMKELEVQSISKEVSGVIRLVNSFPYLTPPLND